MEHGGHRRRAADDLAVGGRDAGDHRLARELSEPQQRAFTHACRVHAIVEQLDQRLCQRPRVARWRQEPALCIHDRLADPPDVAGHDRSGQRHRFEDDVGKRLRPGGVYEHVHAAQSARRVAARAEEVHGACDPECACLLA